MMIIKVVVTRIGGQKWSIEEMINGVKTIHVRTEVIPTMAKTQQRQWS